MTFARLLTLFTALALPFGTARALNWTESVDGDLSGNGSAPTFITFTEGSNLINGIMGAPGGVGPVDADVWRFTITAGYYLTGISLVGYSAPTSGNDSFMALDDATTINMSDPSQHLSNGLWTEQLDGFGNTYTDLMAILDAGPQFGGTGFDGPLGPGDYTFWVQEGSEQIQYSINFQMTAVPEPGSAMLLGLAGLLVLRRRRSGSMCSMG